MPYVNIKVAGDLTKEQKSELAAGVTKLLQDIVGKPPERTYVVFEEVSRENWASAGKLLVDQ